MLGAMENIALLNNNRNVHTAHSQKINIKKKIIKFSVLN